MMYSSFSLARPSSTMRRKRSRTSRSCKEPGAFSARAAQIFQDYTFLHESRNEVQGNFYGDSRSNGAVIASPQP
jgi:hypothetical protein